MSRVLLLTAFLLLLTGTTGSSVAIPQKQKKFATILIFKTGNDLRKTCNNFEKSTDNPFAGLACGNYIRGIYESLLLTDHNSNGSTNLPRSCPGEGVSMEQILAVVTKWMNSHPENWDAYAVSIVAEATKEAFPCE
jgi:hypothetical protein